MFPFSGLKLHLAHDRAGVAHPAGDPQAASRAAVPWRGARAGAWLVGPGWWVVWGLVALVAALPLILAEFPPLYDYYHWL
jgi:hypothetical protein